MKTLQQNLWEKAATVFSPSNQKTKNIINILLFLSLLFLPFQFGKHLWPHFAFVEGQRVDYLSPTLYFSDIFIIFLFILLAAKFIKKIHFIFWLGLLFLSIGVFFSGSPLAGWYGVIKFIEFVFFGWVVSQNKEKVFKILFWVFSLGTIIEGILAIWQVLIQGSVNGLWYFLGERSFSASTPGIANATINGQLVLRPYATFSHPNVFAGYLVIALIFFLALLLFSTNTKMRIVSLFFMLSGPVVLFLTLSRVAIIMWFLACILAFVFIKQKNKKIIIGLIITFVFASFLIPFFAGRFLDSSSYTEAVSQRLELLQAAWNMFVRQPLLGVGLNNFYTMLPSFFLGKVQFGFIQPVHNIFLLALSQTGILGLIIFLFVILLAFVSSLSNFKANKRLSVFTSLSLLSIIFIGSTDHYFLTLQQGQLLFALILGLCLDSGTIAFVWHSIKNWQSIRFTKS